MGGLTAMGYGCTSMRIERNKNGYEVTVTDPAIVAANEKSRSSDGPSDWKNPDVEYQFQTKDQVLAFVTAAFDKALPEEEYSSTFDKLAKDAAKP